MDTDKLEVLHDLSVGARVAEEEKEQLAAYFVETDQWRKIFAGEVDVVYGPKGSGKSAIYTVLIARTNDLFDRGVLLESAENPTGAPAFKDLVADPPTSEPEFTALWKLYVVSLVGGLLTEYEITNAPSVKLRELLQEAKLLPAQPSLGARVRSILEYVRRLLNPESIEAGVKLDPSTGMPVGITGKIVLREPSTDLTDRGFLSVDGCIDLANSALAGSGLEVWLLFDRLDVAFAGSAELEANALRALFKVYLDTVPLKQIVLKIFLRSDIWRSITDKGFREASHITRTLTISWERDTLLNLIMRRLVQSTRFNEFYDIQPGDVVASISAQNALLHRIFPEKVDSGRNPETFDWMVGRVRDGAGQTAPRELIHLLSSARDKQIRIVESGGQMPPEEQIIDRQALREALPEVSRVRLEQTLFAEYPDLKARLEALRGEKTNQSPESLADLWRLGPDDARSLADRLVEIGFFESRGTKESPTYRVPFLYRGALEMVQGTADTDE